MVANSLFGLLVVLGVLALLALILWIIFEKSRSRSKFYRDANLPQCYSNPTRSGFSSRH
jgi:hypothetical protein